MTAQRLALTGGYPDGVWSCAWCAAELADGGIAHREDCRWIADIAAKAHAAQRERLAAGTGCITPCDDDCELQPDGCHELHQIPRKRTHLPQFCADIRAAIGAAVAAERERLAKAAGELKFTLYRPGNGPGAGSQALDVVPLTGLLALLRAQPPATEGTTDAT